MGKTDKTAMKGSVPERMSSLTRSQLLSELGRKVAREKKAVGATARVLPGRSVPISFIK